MDTEFVKVVALALSMWLALVLFYKSFEVEWPDRYFDGVRGVDPVVTRTSGRYFVFRIAPFFLATLVVSAVAKRIGVPSGITIWAGTALYVGTGPLFRAGVAWVRKPRRLGSVAHRLVTATLLVIAAAGAQLVTDDVEPYVPSLKETILAGWIALFIFLLSRLGLVLTTIQRPTDESLVQRALDEIPVGDIGRLLAADPSGTFLTVAVIEQLNRPRWVRRLENVMPGELTRGMMQVKSRVPISDEESIDRFLATHAARMGNEYWTDSERMSFFTRHNPTPEFVEFAERIHWMVGWQGEQRIKIN